MTLESATAIADFFQSILTIAAIVAGLYWFFKQRQRYPRANAELSASHCTLREKTYLLSVRVRISNIGQVRIRSSYARASISVILPFQSQLFEQALAKRKEEKSGLLIWNEYKARESGKELFLEPGETDQLQFDFEDIEEAAQRVGIYVLIENPSLTKTNVLAEKHGWKVLGEYDFTQSRLYC